MTNSHTPHHTPSTRPAGPAQVRHPWRSTARTVAVAALALIPALPDIARAAGIDTVPVVASILTITAAIQRVVTLPAVEAWLQRWTPLGSVSPDDAEAYTHTPQRNPHDNN